MAPIKPKKAASTGKKSPSQTGKVQGPSKSKQKPGSMKKKTSKALARKKKRTYTAEELGLPELNMITPAGVQKPKGKKKGKVFVDDQESMMTILAMVNADKEGQIESKMIKARQMEAIREARQKEAEIRQEQKRAKFEETKDSLRKGVRQKSDSSGTASLQKQESSRPPKPAKKRVSFG